MAQIEKGAAAAAREFRSVAEFYPFYLSQHESRSNRRLHFIGTSLVLAFILLAIVTGKYLLLLVLPIAGYGFAWLGHFAFEKNRPATFTYPLYSLACDFVMYRDMLIGRIKF